MRLPIRFPVDAVILFACTSACACGHGRRPEVPGETVPMSVSFTAYPTMSIHVVADEVARRTADGTLAYLEESLIDVARTIRLGTDVLDVGERGALDLRGTVLKLDRRYLNESYAAEEIQMRFDLLDVERETVVASFDVLERDGSGPLDRRFRALYNRVVNRVEAWLRRRRASLHRPTHFGILAYDVSAR
jgi:hypothetical protein